MATANTRVRVVAAGVLAGAALAVPLLAGPAAPSTTTATGPCLAWFGSRDDGICMGYSNGAPSYIGTPNMGVYGPGYGNGLGIVTGPLMPGTTINQGLNP